MVKDDGGPMLKAGTAGVDGDQPPPYSRSFVMTDDKQGEWVFGPVETWLGCNYVEAAYVRTSGEWFLR